MANVVICYGTLSSAVYYIVDVPGDRVYSRERAWTELGTVRNGSLLMRNRPDMTSLL